MTSGRVHDDRHDPQRIGRQQLRHSGWSLRSAVRLVAVCAIVCLAPAFARGLSATEQTAATSIASLQLGLQGTYKVGYWTPLKVEVLAGDGDQISGGQLEVILPDGDGVPTRYLSETPLQMQAGKQQSATLYVKPGRFNPEITVRLRLGDDLLAERVFSATEIAAKHHALEPNQPLLVMIGAPLDVDSPTQTAASGIATHKVHYSNLQGLPDRWYGYDGVDVVVLSTSDPSLLGLSELDARTTLAALRQWVAQGGRLVWSCGSQAKELLDGEPFASFLPGKFADTVVLRQSSAIEAYADSADRMDEPLGAEPREIELTVARLNDVRGQIEAYEGKRSTDLPLVVRQAYGFGELIFVAFDLDQPPINDWVARQQLFDRLLARPKLKPGAEAAQHGRVATLGYTDLSGQLRSALDQFPGIPLIPFWLVAVLILAYLLVIGPLDYYFLRHVLKRMELTWVTFPATIVIFCLAAYVLATQFKGDRLLCNEIDLVDYDVESGAVRGTHWSNLYSPQIADYDLQLAPTMTHPTGNTRDEVLLSWLGLPGDALGGMGTATSRAAANTTFSSGYTIGPGTDKLQDLPIANWATKGLAARWSGSAPPRISAELSDRGGRLLAGTIESKLDQPLEHCVLLYDRWAFPIRTLAPGQKVSVTRDLDAQTLETFFKHMTVVSDKSVTRPYDRSSFDVPSILDMMMFYELIGGEQYVGLSNSYQHDIDATAALRAGRAILVGRLTEPGAQLIANEQQIPPAQTQRWTFCRYFLPVSPPSQ